MAVAHSILKIVWHLLTRKVDYQDLGTEYFQRQNLEAHKRAYIKKLEKLGYSVTLSPLAA